MGHKTLANSEWLHLLKSDGPGQDETIEILRQLLLRAALYTMARNLSEFPGRGQAEIMALAEDCAQDALLAILKQLDGFRGDSLFTTWAYKFAVHKALETARRERWKGRSLDPLLEDADNCNWVYTGAARTEDPEVPAGQAEIWQIVRRVVRDDLTERQRQVFKLMIFDEVPMDVVTERLNTNRNAVYKVLHDARKKVRFRLEEHGYAIQEVLEMFSVSYSIDTNGTLQGQQR
jgi:RNA polymerase sigma-70 factor (ECF subfamily)